MRFMRRRSERHDAARVRLGSSLEALEGRLLLTGDPLPGPFSIYNPSDIAISNPITHQPLGFSVLKNLQNNPSQQNSLLNNEGKIVSGEDRNGDQWTITVHGPGVAIVTDITPGDGALDDPINSIQLIGTNINSTYVTGTVVASNRILTSGIVDFNNLTDLSGVRSIALNGFSLKQTIAPPNGAPNNSQTGIFLTGGVRYLSFANIEAPVDTFATAGGTSDSGINIVIGDPSTPLTVAPTIVLNNIENTVFDTTQTSVPANNVPNTTPTVSIIVNGKLQALDFISTTQNSNIAASQQFLFPIVTTTGRTSVQATSVGNLSVEGAATNLTVSRSATPFQNGLTGLSSLGHAHFHGPTDAVGIDVNGPIKGLKFDKGLGNPTGVFPATNGSGQTLPQTNDGLPINEYGYAAVGLVSGQVTATSIGKITAKPANIKLQTPSNPAFVQLREPGEPHYVVRNGNALTNAVIAASGNIGKTSITGDLVNSEIKAGFHYPSFAAGLEGTRAASKIGPLHQNGNDINGVISASYRASTDKVYDTGDDVVGPGKIQGKFAITGKLYNTGGVTPLNNTGAGNFAKKKVGGYLPPSETTSRPGDQTLIR